MVTNTSPKETDSDADGRHKGSPETPHPKELVRLFLPIMIENDDFEDRCR